MRIFKTYYFNAANICKFNDTFDLVEKILQSNGLTYQKIWFKFFSPVDGEIEKIVRKIPQIKDYYFISNFRGSTEHIITNFDDQWEDGNPFEYLPVFKPEMIRQVVKRVPRPFNIPFNVVIFDEINWFGESAISIQQKAKGSLRGINTDIDSSHIAIMKEFDYGNKNNPIKIRIEVTDYTGSGIRDDSKIAVKLSDSFGDFIMSDMSCAFEEHEKEEYKLKETEAAELTDNIESSFWDRKKHMPVDSGILPHRLVWDASSDMKFLLADTPKMSPRNAILKVFGQTDYRYLGSENLYYGIDKIDDFNNRILLGISMAPNCRRLEAYLEYNGLGFSFRMNLGSYTPDDQNGVIKFIENVYAAVRYLEQDYFPRIKKIYGKTPVWFQYAGKDKR